MAAAVATAALAYRSWGSVSGEGQGWAGLGEGGAAVELLGRSRVKPRRARRAAVFLSRRRRRAPARPQSPTAAASGPRPSLSWRSWRRTSERYRLVLYSGLANGLGQTARWSRPADARLAPWCSHAPRPCVRRGGSASAARLVRRPSVGRSLACTLGAQLRLNVFSTSCFGASHSLELPLTVSAAPLSSIRHPHL